MNPKIIAGASGVASLALLALLGSRTPNHNISRRAIEIEDEVVINDDSADDWNEDNYAQLLKDIHLEFDMMNDVQQKAYTGNWNSMKSYMQPYSLETIHDDMLKEHNDRMAEGATWHDNLVTPAAATFQNATGTGTCEWGNDQATATTDGCAKIDGMDFTSPHVAKIVADNNCATDEPFVNDDNTNVWFLIPRAIPLYASNGTNHVTDWQNYFKFVRGLAEAWWKRDHRPRIVRLTIGLYTTGVQLIPKGIKMTAKSPLEKLLKWYRKPAMTAAKPRFSSVLRVLDQSIGSTVYAKNTGNGVVAGSSETKDNCFALVFIQDVPRDVVSLHMKDESGNKPKTGDFVASLNEKCNMNYAFVMPGARTKGSDTDKFINKMMMVLQPGLNEWFPYDPDYSGFYRLTNYAELLSDNFKNHVRNAMCLQSKRQQCKLKVKGATVNPTVATSYAGEYSYTDYSSYAYTKDDEPVAEASGWTDAVYGDADRTDDEVHVADPQCCGGAIYSSKQFDNKLKECAVNDFDDDYSVKARTLI